MSTTTEISAAFEEWWNSLDNAWKAASAAWIAPAAWNAAMNRAQPRIAELEARLAQLEWRPVSVKPTAEDTDARCKVDTVSGLGHIYQAHIGDHPWGNVYTHWRPAALPKQEPFDRWYAKHGGKYPDREEAETAWKEARQ